MYTAAIKFFALHHYLHLPGIGSLIAEPKPALLDFTDRTITAPAYNILFKDEEQSSGKTFYAFLSNELQLTENAAATVFSAFTDELKQRLTSGDILQLSGIGTLRKESSGEVLFQAEEMPDFFPKLIAERIVRKNTTHTVRVGEDEKTSAEMQTALHHSKSIKKERWWVAALVLALAGIIAITLYYTLLT
jgi:hypothetical protein